MAKNPYFPDGDDDQSSPKPARKPALPDWAQITADIADIGDDVAPRPADSSAGGPARPRPNRPAAQPPVTPPPAVPTPAVVPTPTVPTSVPVTPEPVAAPAAAPVPPVTPAAEPAAPAAKSEPAPPAPVAPTPAVETPVSAPAAAPTVDPIPAPPVPASQPAASAPAETLPEKAKPASTTKQARAKLPLFANRPTSADAAASSAKPGKARSGGRWKVIALRVSIWFTLFVIILAGGWAIVGPKGPSVTKITDQVLASMGRTDAFPTETAQQLAVRFAREYLTVDPNGTSARAAALATYLPGGAQMEFLLSSGNDMPQQTVVAGPYLASIPQVIDDTHVVFTFAAQVKRPTVLGPNRQPLPPVWLYLAVPVTAAADGSVAVSGAPALVPAPAVAEAVEGLEFETDEDAAKLAKDSIGKFLSMWAASDEAGLSPYLVSGESTNATSAGLGGAVTFMSVRSLTVEALPEGTKATACTGPDFEAPCRKADVTVVWSMNGSSVVQDYRMVLFNDGEYWRVLDIQGGNFEAN